MNSTRSADTRRALDLVLATAFRVDWKLAFAALALLLMERSIGPVVALGSKALVDGVARGSVGGIITGCAVLAGYSGLVVVLGFPRFVMFTTLNEKTSIYMDKHLATLLSSSPQLGHFEDPGFSNRLQMIRDRRQELTEPAGTVAFAVAAVFEAVVTLVLLIQVSPWLLRILLVGCASIATGGLSARIRNAAWLAAMETSRRARYLFGLGTSPLPAKEIRAYQMGSKLIDQYVTVANRSAETKRRGILRALPARIADAVLAALTLFGAVLFVAIRVYRGEASPGDLVLTILLVGRAFGAVYGAAQNVGSLIQVVGLARALTWMERFVTSATGRGAVVARPLDLGLTTVPEHRGITLDHVGFTYPGTDHVVLEDVSLDLTPGTVTAIVGENGAGKTTLTKLLLGLYVPSRGAILIDGKPMPDIGTTSWLEATTGTFQEFIRPEFPARVVVSLGDLSVAEDSGRVDAVIERAGGSGLIRRLPAGLDTPLGRSFPDGYDLSGGEWQKLALARGLMRDVTRLNVLDEPTASLDALAEEQIYRASVSERSIHGDSQTITVLVSHRFSTVKWADRIVVLHGGRVESIGTHSELMRGSERYSELYNLHARHYVGDGR